MNTERTAPFKYDVFIGHGHHDKQAAQELAERLSNDGLQVWFEEWELKNNYDREQTIANALQDSRTLALLISSNIMPSEWVILERHTIAFRHPANQARRFVPLMLDNVDIKEPLKQFAFIDWRQKATDEYAKLLSICRPPSVTNLHLQQRSRKPNIFKGHAGDVVGVAITPNGRRVVSSGRDGTIRIWNTSSGKCLSILKGHQKSVRTLAVTPDGLKIISGSGDTTIRVWDLRTLNCIVMLEDHIAPVLSVVVTPDAHSLVSGSADRTIRIWDLRKIWLEPIAILEGHIGYVLSLAVMPDGRHIVSGSQDATIRIWDLNSLECVAVLEGHYGGVNAVSVTPDGRRIVSGSEDKTLKVWMVASG